MSIIKKSVILTVCLAMLFTMVFAFPASAEEVKKTRIVVDDGINIRADAGTTFEIVGATTGKTVVDYLGSKNDAGGNEWAHILTDDKIEGYVMAVFTEPYDPEKKDPRDDTRKRLVIEDGVNIRDAAVSGNVVYSTGRFIEVAIIDTVDSLDPVWYHIETDWGLEGYVSSAFSHVVPDASETDEDGDIEYPPTDKYIMSTAMSVNIRKGAGLNNDILGEIWPCKLPCYGVETDTDGMKWYKIYTPGGLYAYIREDFVEEYTYKEDPEFEKTLADFPESYRDGLRHLHTLHPNWKFAADKLNVTLEEAAKAEAGYKELSNLYISISEDWRTKGEGLAQRGYKYASQKAIKYVMEPSNFLVSTGIFMFMDQAYDSKTQTKDGIKDLLKQTFMDPDEYADYFIEAAEKSGVNPYALIGLVISETGYSESEFTSGKNADYPECYNFFGLGASGFTEDEELKEGLKYAKSKGWTTPKAAIIGGAEEYGANYVNFGQYTYYYKNFNVINEHYYFQYSMDILDQMLNASVIADVCSANMSEITFKIPVYKVNAPEPQPVPQPTPVSPQTGSGLPALIFESALAALMGFAACLKGKRRTA